MNLTEQINQIFDNFQDPACRAEAYEGSGMIICVDGR